VTSPVGRVTHRTAKQEQGHRLLIETLQIRAVFGRDQHRLHQRGPSQLGTAFVNATRSLGFFRVRHAVRCRSTWPIGPRRQSRFTSPITLNRIAPVILPIPLMLVRPWCPSSFEPASPMVFSNSETLRFRLRICSTIIVVIASINRDQFDSWLRRPSSGKAGLHPWLRSRPIFDSA